MARQLAAVFVLGRRTRAWSLPDEKPCGTCTLSIAFVWRVLVDRAGDEQNKRALTRMPTPDVWSMPLAMVHPAFAPRIRLARPNELDTLVAIDDDASGLYSEHGVALQLASTDSFALAERQRWLAAAQAARAFLAVDASGVCLGFAALDSLDGEPYLDQLAVQRAFMRRGVGQLLLEQAVSWAERQAGDGLWLTTYAHVPFNRPYYERHGFVVVSELECGQGIRHHLEEQRRALPAPSERVVMRRPLRRQCGEVGPH